MFNGSSYWAGRLKLTKTLNHLYDVFVLVPYIDSLISFFLFCVLNRYGPCDEAVQKEDVKKTETKNLKKITVNQLAKPFVNVKSVEKIYLLL